MSVLQLCLSDSFEKLCRGQCGQIGSFALINTTMPYATENRLNKGWLYTNGPRKGTLTPPLAYFVDWKVERHWSVISTEISITNTPESRKAFGRPCVIRQIEDRLMKDDNVLFPELRARGLSKNSLDNVFVLKSGTYHIRNEANCNDDEDYERLVVQSIVAQVQSVIDTLGVKIDVTEVTDVEEDHDVKSE